MRTFLCHRPVIKFYVQSLGKFNKYEELSTKFWALCYGVHIILLINRGCNVLIIDIIIK
jgi:hypothetical protein